MLNALQDAAVQNVIELWLEQASDRMSKGYAKLAIKIPEISLKLNFASLFPVSHYAALCNPGRLERGEVDPAALRPHPLMPFPPHST